MLRSCVLLALVLLACDRPDPSKTGVPGAASSSPPILLPEAGPGILELFGGLRKGDLLGPLRVEHVSIIERGQITLRLSKADAVGQLAVARLDDKGPLPPVKTQKYGIFFLTPLPGLPALSQGELTAASEALAERIRASEDRVPIPAGLSSYPTRAL